MASIRRILSPVPKPGGLSNGEACQVSSPLSKSSSNSQNHPSSLDYALYGAQSIALGLCSRRSSRPVDRSRIKGQIWWRAYLHFVICFVFGIFVGFTPLAPLNFSRSIAPRHESIEFELMQNEVSLVEKVQNLTVEPKIDPTFKNSSGLFLDVVSEKLLIVITATKTRPLQGYYLSRLAQTLKLIRHPLLWIVVEMSHQTMDTSELLRNSGVMYRHLVCRAENASETTDRNALLRNVAISHVETHRLDGIVYFADDDGVYSTSLFDQMRNISRIGIWTVARLVKSKGEIIMEGPICNGSQVVGWHIVNTKKRSRRFHAEISSFAFNSTIIWDSKRWHRPTLEPIRQLETVKQDMQASTFIEQFVEDESQMECFSTNNLGIMVWHHTNDGFLYPQNRFDTVLSIITRLE